MTDSFAVHLGGGAYLDASGKIVFGTPDNAQIYQAPGGFRLDTKKIQEAFKDLSGMLPADDDAKKKWLKWGVPADVVDFLGKIAGVASIVATAISVYVWAIGVLIAIMDLMSDDDEGMSPELAKTLYSIKNHSACRTSRFPAPNIRRRPSCRSGRGRSSRCRWAVARRAGIRIRPMPSVRSILSATTTTSSGTVT
jgi:hypothetical protein